MKIVIDDKIPFIREAVSQITDEAIYKSGPLIGPDDIKAVIERFNTEHPGEYEFVTIDQLDEVYLKSINS